MTAFDTGPCLRFPGQAQFHPLKYLAGLAQAIERRGGRLYVAHADTIEGGKDAKVTLRRFSGFGRGVLRALTAALGPLDAGPIAV